MNGSQLFHCFFRMLAGALAAAVLWAVPSRASNAALIPDMATIKIDCAAVIVQLQTKFMDTFPGGSASEAGTDSEVDAHIRRIERWRRDSLDGEARKGDPQALFELERKRIAKAVDDFDAETERLRKQGNLTPEQSQARKLDYAEGRALTGSTGPLLDFYRTWVARMKAAVREWKQRSKEL